MSVDRESAGSALIKERESFAKKEVGPGPRTIRRKAATLAAHTALVVGSVVLSLAVLEIGCRLLRSGPEALLHWPNLARARMSNSEDGSMSCAYAYDDRLGWTLPANCMSATYNVTDGFRRTPALSAVAEPPILATGSSFTQGDEVSDEETWPTYLQNLTGQKVLNAGVSGYALDQSVLRTERLVAEVKPRFVVLSFTPSDVRRTELKVAWSREKPYFAVVDGHLELRNVPVPGHPHMPVPLPLAARLLGWSTLADEVVKRLGIQQGWYFDEVQAEPPGTGGTIACLLMPRLARLGVPVVVMAQYSRSAWTADAEGKARNARIIGKVLGCAAEAGLIPFDLAGPLKPAVDARGVDALFRTDHHSPEGNRAVAELIAGELLRRHLLPTTARN